MRKLWIELRSSLWFVPGLLVLVAILVALGLVELDIVFAKQLRANSWTPLLNAGSDGARGMLTAIASSMITVAGVAFSVTIVTLSLASTQYTPRILRNFMRDRANQFVLGVFVAVFTYCLVVLRTIRGSSDQDGPSFVPILAVAFALGLALLSIGSLIFFIHHIAASIQASTILKAITDETIAAIDVLFPQKMGEGEEQEYAAAEISNANWIPLASDASGYLQNVDSDGLMHFAREQDLVLRLERSPGDFVGAGAPLVSVNGECREDTFEKLRPFFVIGDFRTVEQDAGFGIRQIVDVAMKALSPGVNDTSTAVTCLNYLNVLLCRFAQRSMESPYRAEEGTLRVIAPVPSFEDYLAKSLDEIRLSAAGNVTILLQMLCVLERVAGVTQNLVRREALIAHAQHVLELADRSVPAAYDRRRINSAVRTLREALGVGQERLPFVVEQCDQGNIKYLTT